MSQLSLDSLQSNATNFRQMKLKYGQSDVPNKLLSLDVRTIETQTSLTDLRETGTQCNLSLNDQAGTTTTTTSSSQTDFRHSIEAHHVTKIQVHHGPASSVDSDVDILRAPAPAPPTHFRGRRGGVALEDVQFALQPEESIDSYI